MDKERLMSILISKNNDYFRGTLDKNDESYIYDAQINTARKIVMQLASNTYRTNHVMLLAPMQSGKTATCISVINIINKSLLYKNMAINKYLFISGMNDCGLKSQTYKRVLDQVIDANESNVYHNKKSNSKSKYFVLKNSDLLSYDGILDNSLIFIDESHYGSNEKNILTQFLVKHGVDWKNTEDLIKRNIYIVSVSATPFDELISDRIQSKRMVELDTDDEYVGVSNYLKNDVIFDADKDDITEDGAIFDYIMDAHWRMQDSKKLGVIFIRTRNFDIIKNNGYVKDNFNVYEMYASGSNIQYSELDNKMSELYNANLTNDLGDLKPLIVLIKGAFRAGITIKPKFKDIIYMIHDYSVKADTTAQALLGRMCGYRDKDSVITNTYFYLNKKFADMYSAWENDFQNKDLIPCNKTEWEWVDNGYTGDDVKFGSRPCGNFSIPLSNDEIKEIFLLGKGKRNRAKLIENRFNELLKKNNVSIKYDYINEVHISGKNHYAKSSQEKRFNSFNEDSLVFQFRPEKIKQFIVDTNRDYLTHEDVGKRCVSIVLDANILDDTAENISGNKRLLIYYVEVGQKQMVYSRKGQYKPHKDTEI